MLFLAVQSTYDAVELGLFDSSFCIGKQSVSKIDASAQLIPILDTLLRHHGVRYQELPFCAVSQGPGPFTTLRTVIATMNGLAYATHIPLVGVNALIALIHEYDSLAQHNVCALLQAFSGDVYMGWRLAGASEVQVRVIALASLPSYIQLAQVDQVHIIGNGALLCKDILFSDSINSVINTTSFLHSSLDAIAQNGYEEWTKKNRGSLSLRPLYLKNHPAQN